VGDAATVLSTTARRRWESLSPMVDDITAIVIDLRPHMISGGGGGKGGQGASSS